ncbi:3-dehydroquinate dehydratase (3-dehydroquinase), partial [Quaeritorhiza haematococci]
EGAHVGGSGMLGHVVTTSNNTTTAANGNGAVVVQGAAAVETMRDKIDRMYPLGDIIKVIGRAHSFSDNISLHRTITSYTQSTPHAKPLIALNMGPHGQLSRSLNKFLTPVTHPALPASAAPGQLSVAQIHTLRALTADGIPTNGESFTLFGTPIKHSMSPALHNAGFKALGLPFTYRLFETDDVEKVRELVRNRRASPGAGEEEIMGWSGASVTIPLKEAVIKAGGIPDLVSPAATAIGAVNTLGSVAEEDREDGKRVVWGDNTDWLGIRACIEKRCGGFGVHVRKPDGEVVARRMRGEQSVVASVSAPVANEAGLPVPDTISGVGTGTPLKAITAKPPRIIGIVIGAGGTARAACYALQSLETCVQLRVWNRTHAKAIELAQRFGGVAVESVGDVFKIEKTNEDAGPVLFVVVATVPGDAQLGIDLDAMFAPITSSSTTTATVSVLGGILVELAYKPRQTRLVEKVTALGGEEKGQKWFAVEGIEVLVEQGYEQFWRWTGRKAPKGVMFEEVMRGYEA